MWAEHPDPQAWPQVALSPDGRWLLVEVTCGWSRVDIHVLDRSTDAWVTLVAGVDAPTELTFDADGTALVGVTHIEASRGRVVRVALDHDALAAGPAAWDTLVPERDDVISAFGVGRDGLYMVTSRAALDTIWTLDADGTSPQAVAGLPAAVAVAGLATDRRRSDAFVLLDSYTGPTAAWRVARDAAPEPWGDVADDPSALTGTLRVTTTSYRSLDGTEVGLFLVHRADVTPSPATPAILDGYGGFAITKAPAFVAHAAAWCAAGGLFAVAGLRGGWEHGEAWHLAGNRANKQNVFDDFQAAADHLVAEGLTSRDRLAVHGGSNGGLLVGATLTQRPDLCRAVWCRVPLLDMIRFPQFRIARLWTAEYGDPDIADEFAWLYAYSPYHHVVDGTCYPATLIQTAEGDSRVDPMHARKMVAALQAASACRDRNPVVLSQEGRAGHGVGKPVGKRADEFADGLTFIGGQLGLDSVTPAVDWLTVGGALEAWTVSVSWPPPTAAARAAASPCSARGSTSPAYPPSTGSSGGSGPASTRPSPTSTGSPPGWLRPPPRCTPPIRSARPASTTWWWPPTRWPARAGRSPTPPVRR